MTGHDIRPIVDLRRERTTDSSTIVRRGKMFVGTAFGIFLVWATVVPLSSAVVAEGEISSDGQNKALQQVYGGRVASIDVVDGARIQEGQLILTLEASQRSGELSELRARYDVLQAKLLKLRSIDSVATAGVYGVWSIRNAIGDPIETASVSNGAAVDVFAAQRNEGFQTLELDNAEQLAALSRISRLRASMASKAASRTSLETSLDLLTLEGERMRPLVKKGYLAEDRYWQLSRNIAATKADLAAMDAETAALEDQILEEESNLNALVARKQVERSRELSQVLDELSQIDGKIKAAEVALASLEVRSPVSGSLVNFSANTVGGVIRAGEVFGEIVPEGAELIAEARVKPEDITNVHLGQSARVTVTSLDRRRFDPIDAEVTYVSADSIDDKLTGSSHYLVRARFNAAELDPRTYEMLKPGMKLLLYVDTGSRSFLAYLARPISSSFESAFREY